MKELVKELEVECKDALFCDPHDIDLSRPYDARVNTALHYFHNYSITKSVKDNPDYALFEPFELRCEVDGILKSKNDYLKFLVEYINHKDTSDQKPIETSLVYANFDTKYLNLRVAVIPESLMDSFFEMRFNYTRLGPPDTGKGILYKIAKMFPKEYNIWRLYNHTAASRAFMEEGNIVFLIQDLKKRSFDENANRVSNGIFNGVKLVREGSNIRITKPSIQDINFQSVKAALDNQYSKRKEYLYDVFLSYCKDDLEQAQEIKAKLESKQLKCFLAKTNLGPGAIFENEIREALLLSREFCVICSETSMGRQWVTSEWAAAWVLNKFTVPVLYQMPPQKLPDRLRKFQAIDFSKIDDYVMDVLTRK